MKNYIVLISAGNKSMKHFTSARNSAEAVMQAFKELRETLGDKTEITFKVVVTVKE